MAKIYQATTGVAVSPSRVDTESVSGRTRVVEFRIDPSDRILVEPGDVVTVGQVIARAEISAKLGDLEAQSEQEMGRLNQELQELQLELARAREKLLRNREDSQTIQNELDRLSEEPLLVSDFVRLGKSGSTLEKDAVQLQERIADVARKAVELNEKKRLAIESSARKKARLKKDSSIQSSFSGKILRIDHHPEGEKIRLSVLYRSVYPEPQESPKLASPVFSLSKAPRGAISN